MDIKEVLLNIIDDIGIFAWLGLSKEEQNRLISIEIYGDI